MRFLIWSLLLCTTSVNALETALPRFLKLDGHFYPIAETAETAYVTDLRILAITNVALANCHRPNYVAQNVGEQALYYGTDLSNIIQLMGDIQITLWPAIVFDAHTEMGDLVCDNPVPEPWILNEFVLIDGFEE